VRFFIDNCIAKKIAQSIAILAQGQDQQVTHLTEKFEPDVTDVEWIRALQAEGDWIIVSADPRISRNRIEQAAWQESGLTAFFFSDFSRRRFWAQAQELVNRWPDIVEAARGSLPGTGYLVKPRQKDFEVIFHPRHEQP
jgi:hypothetical protein